MNEGVVYIISNPPGKKHRSIFELLCNKSIALVKQHMKLPTALLSFGVNKNVNADIHIDGSEYFKKYQDMNKNEELHGLVAAELLKTHITEWSPFDKTLYLDCDAFVMQKSAKDYLGALDMGYDLSLSTCITMEWKDSIAIAPINKQLFGTAPSYFPYWNFGVFGSHKKSDGLMSKIREEFLSYCFGKWGNFNGGCPHAQPAIVRAAHSLAPNHKIFTMPTKYNCHLAAAGGYIYSGTPVILHFWKDIRGLMVTGEDI